MLAPVAQLDRVSDSDSEGHRFDSCRVYHIKNASRTEKFSLRFVINFNAIFDRFAFLALCQYFTNCIAIQQQLLKPLNDLHIKLFFSFLPIRHMNS